MSLENAFKAYWRVVGKTGSLAALSKPNQHEKRRTILSAFLKRPATDNECSPYAFRVTLYKAAGIPIGTPARIEDKLWQNQYVKFCQTNEYLPVYESWKVE
jgi:hypothetical protein